MGHVLEQDKIESYCVAGKATVTIANEKRGTSFTFQVMAPKKKTPKGGVKVDYDANVRFVSLLTGSNNESGYTYLGTLHRQQDGSWLYRHGAKSPIGKDARGAKAFAWTWENLGQLPPALVVRHSGKCGRCKRKLTTVESLNSGIGPECAKK